MYELEPVRNIPKPEKPEEPEEAPPIDIPPPTISGKSGTGTGIITKGKEVPIGADIIDPFSVSDSNAIALVQVQPVYPQRALQKEIEGYVVVEFDVDEGGRVINPRVLYAEPEGYFETASLRALERYRYQPRVVNGQTVKMFGVQQKLSFTLAD
jgi:protein TonB